jgi:hypothetical protein
MNAAPLLHGSVGYLDELLVCGVGLACILFAVFIAGVRGSKDEDVDGEKQTDERVDQI